MSKAELISILFDNDFLSRDDFHTSINVYAYDGELNIIFFFFFLKNPPPPKFSPFPLPPPFPTPPPPRARRCSCTVRSGSCSSPTSPRRCRSATRSRTRPFEQSRRTSRTPGGSWAAGDCACCA